MTPIADDRNHRRFGSGLCPGRIGVEGRWAESLIEEDQISAPELVMPETINSLRRLESSGRISQREADGAFRDLMDFRISLYSFEPFAARVWELRFNLTSYDAWYVALAESLDCPLATLDARIRRATGPTCEMTFPTV